MALSLAMQAISIAVDVTGGLNGLREFPPLQFRIPGLFVLTIAGMGTVLRHGNHIGSTASGSLQDRAVLLRQKPGGHQG